MIKLKTRLLAATIGFTLSLLAVNVAAAGVYKWTDTDGNVHYSDRSSKSAEKLQVKASEKQDAGMNKRRDSRDRLLSVLEEERNEKKREKAISVKDKVTKQANCIKAQDDLQQYQTASYLYTLDEDGTRKVLEGEEYAEAMRQAETAVSLWCV